MSSGQRLVLLFLTVLLLSTVSAAHSKHKCASKLSAYVLTICGSECPKEIEILKIGCSGYKRLEVEEVRDLCCPEM